MKLEQPAQTDARHPTDATQREAFEQQLFDQLFGRVADVLRVSDELAVTFQALIILFLIGGVTIAFDMR